MTDEELHARCVIRQSNIELREVLQAEIEQISLEIGNELGTRGIDKIDVGEFTPQIVYQTRKTLDQKKLVEMGVPVATIEACTTEKDSQQLRVTRRKV